MDAVFENKSLKLFAVLLGLSFFMHLGVMLNKVSWSVPSLKDEIVESKPIQITIKSSNAKQIVRTEKSKEQMPSAAEYLSEQNNSFDRETKALDVGAFKRAGIGVRNANDDTQTQKAQKGGEKIKKVASLKDLSLSPQMDLGDLDQKRVQQLNKKGLENGDMDKSGLSANNDYLDHVPLGDFTQLNTQEFKYYGFYNRIRARLENFWGTSVREKSDELFKAGRRFPASENYITSLIIKIDEKGVIRDVKVKSSSGVRELDEAATESFNKAGPFPNPPKELVKDGMATIEWGFVVKS